MSSNAWASTFAVTFLLAACASVDHDPPNAAVVLTAVGLDAPGGSARHWICAGWTQEPFMVQTAGDFEAALRAEARLIARAL